MSKRVAFKGQEIVNLFNSLNQEENIARKYGTQDREAAVKEREASLRANGQVSAVQIQEDGNGGHHPIAGLTRIAAAARIVTGYSYEAEPNKDGSPNTFVIPPEPSFTLDAIVFGAEELTPQERAIRCVVDNQVEAPSDIDLGHQIAELTKTFGFTLAQCQERLGISDPNKPGECLKLLQLPEWLIEAIHGKIVARTVGLLYLKLKGEPKAAVQKALKEALAKGKGLTEKQCRKIATEAEESVATEDDGGKGEGEGSDGGKETPATKLPIKEVEQGFTTMLADLKSDKASSQSDAQIERVESAIKLFQSFDRWLHGAASYDTLIKNIRKTFGCE